MQSSIRAGKIRDSAADVDDNVPRARPRPRKGVSQLEHLLLKRELAGVLNESRSDRSAGIGPSLPDAGNNGGTELKGRRYFEVRTFAAQRDDARHHFERAQPVRQPHI